MPVSEFETKAAEWSRKVEKTGAPVIVRQNGRPAGAHVARSSRRSHERARFVATVEEGLADVRAGRVIEDKEILRRMKAHTASRRR